MPSSCTADWLHVHGPVALIAAEAARMGRLLRVLAELARSDSGRLQLKLQPHDPDVLLMAYERLSSLADRLQLAMPRRLSPSFRWMDRLQQCLAALVDNALAYGEGLVHFRLNRSAPCRIACSRPWPWYPEQERDRVIQRFQRVDRHRHPRRGLGLALVQQLVSLMDGELRIAIRSWWC